MLWHPSYVFASKQQNVGGPQGFYILNQFLQQAGINIATFVLSIHYWSAVCLLFNPDWEVHLNHALESCLNNFIPEYKKSS